MSRRVLILLTAMVTVVWAVCHNHPVVVHWPAGYHNAVMINRAAYYRAMVGGPGYYNRTVRYRPCTNGSMYTYLGLRRAKSKHGY